MNLLLLALLLQNEKPPDPEEERKTFKLADGFEVNLFAADPLVAKPIQINFDARGRLWVATSSIYPQIGVGETANDKIVILEDTDGDGKADKSSVFADGLFIPTGVEVGDGGAYVANSTELLHLADTDGDGKADRRRVILSGFGTEDTHHIIHTFRWGPEGYLYFNQSIYIHSHIETPHGPRRLGGAGIWRFRPSTLELEVFCRGMCNPWGHTIDPWGQSFGTDGAGGDGIHYLMPGAIYPHFPSGEKHFPGLNPGQPKFCAHEIVNSRHFPDDWQGNIVANDFRANRIARFQISDEGAGFSSKLLPDLLKSSDRAFRPVDVRLGPDGALYVADWYNPIINHGEVGFRDPRRDRTHGRIWRITAKGRPLVARPKLHGAPVAELLERLRDPEDWTRHFAKRELAARDPKEVAPALATWTKAQIDNHPLLEALWTYQTIDVVEPALLKSLLGANDFRARAAAVRALALWHARVPEAQALLEARVADEHPRVRLEAVRALKELGTAQAFEVAMRALERPTDRFLEYTLWRTAYDMKPAWEPAFKEGKITFGGSQKQMAFALQAVKAPMALKGLIQRIREEGWMSDEARANALATVAEYGEPGDLATLFANDKYGPRLQAEVLASLARAVRERSVRPSGDLSRIRKFFQHADPLVRTRAYELGGAWRMESLRADLVKAAEEGSRAAVEALAEIGGDASREFFRKLGGRLGVIGLAAMNLKEAAALAPGAMDGDPGEVFTAFLRRKGGAEALAAVLNEKNLTPDAARVGLRAMYAIGRQEPVLAAVLNRVVGLKPRGEAEIRALAAEASSKGDPARGEAVFRRKELSCFQCHAIGGAGGNVGPDLLSLGASAPVDYITESILRPEAKTKEGYVSVQVLTKDGEVLAGVRVRENAEELVLRDAVRDEIVVRKGRIEAQKQMGSVMPSGLADLLTDAELLDLVRFLSELGKTTPYSVGQAPVLRRWRAQDGTPLYSRVGGDLPVEGPATVRGEVEVTTGGPFRLRVNSPKGLALKVNGQPVELSPEVPLDLKAGVHVLEFTIDSTRQDPLRVEFEEVAGSSSRGRPLGGR